MSSRLIKMTVPGYVSVLLLLLLMSFFFSITNVRCRKISIRACYLPSFLSRLEVTEPVDVRKTPNNFSSQTVCIAIEKLIDAARFRYCITEGAARAALFMI